MRRLLTACLAAVLFTTALSAAPATAAVDPVQAGAVTALAVDWKVSAAEARLRIARQDRMSGLAGAAERSLGDRFAGAWIDHANGGVLVVGVTGGSTADVGLLARAHGVGGLTRVVTLRHSNARLNSIAAALGDRLATANAGASRMVSVRVGTVANTVVLGVPGSMPLTAAQQAFVAGAQARYDGAISLQKEDQQYAASVCWMRDCDAPLRGGVAIRSDNDRGCTAGFITKRADGSKWVLTAGHCQINAGFDPWQFWNTKSANGVSRRFGGGTQFAWFGGSAGRDFGIISIDYASENPVFGVYATANTWKPINGWATATLGMYVCQSGSRSGEGCGTITNTNVSTTYPGGVTVKNMLESNRGSCRGDSGGPVFRNNIWAIGIISGSNFDSSGCGTGSLYSKIDVALSVLGVTLI